MAERKLKIYRIRDWEGYDFGLWVGNDKRDVRRTFYESGAHAGRFPEIDVKEVRFSGYNIVLKKKKLENRV